MRKLDKHFPRRVHHRGFTFVELMMGIVVTAIMMAALAVFAFGVGDNWEDTDQAQSAFLAASAGVDRLNLLVRSAQLIETSPTTGSLNNSTGPASCMIWTDNNPADGLIQYSEMTLLKYDQTNQRLVKITIPSTASNAATQAASLLSDASFAALPNTIITPVVNDVSACQIFSVNPTSTTLHPSLEFVLQMKTSNGSSAELVYSTVTLRGPS
jgi:Tfp pilus assembly protein FimT